MMKKHPLSSNMTRLGGALLALVCAVAILGGCHKAPPRPAQKNPAIDKALASNPASGQVILQTPGPNYTPPPPVRTPAVDWFTAPVKNAQGLVDYARTVKHEPPEITVADQGATLKLVPVLIANNPTPTQLQVPLNTGTFTLGASVSLSEDSPAPALFYVNQMNSDHQRHRLKTIKLNPGEKAPLSLTVTAEEDNVLLILAAELDAKATTTLGAEVSLINLSAVAALHR